MAKQKIIDEVVENLLKLSEDPRYIEVCKGMSIILRDRKLLKEQINSIRSANKIRQGAQLSIIYDLVEKNEALKMKYIPVENDSLSAYKHACRTMYDIKKMEGASAKELKILQVNYTASIKLLENINGR